jgi:hypothetical protein
LFEILGILSVESAYAHWIPACAGMTVQRIVGFKKYSGQQCACAGMTMVGVRWELQK